MWAAVNAKLAGSHIKSPNVFRDVALIQNFWLPVSPSFKSRLMQRCKWLIKRRSSVKIDEENENHKNHLKKHYFKLLKKFKSTAVKFGGATVSPTVDRRLNWSSLPSPRLVRWYCGHRITENSSGNNTHMILHSDQLIDGQHCTDKRKFNVWYEPHWLDLPPRGWSSWRSNRCI